MPIADGPFGSYFGMFADKFGVKLSGKMTDLYSIRINDQWRIVFKWDDGNLSDVTIMDYHK